MNVAAHPLVVAVAMGLLGPGVLADESEATEAPCMDCEAEDRSAMPQGPAAPPELTLTAQPAEVERWLARPMPTEHAQQRARAAYQSSVDLRTGA